MKKTLLSIFAAFVAAVMMCACGSKAEPQDEGAFTIKRGTNLSHWLSQSNVRGEARRNHIQEDDFARLEELGFDHVRIPIDEEQFWDQEAHDYKDKGLVGILMSGKGVEK